MDDNQIIQLYWNRSEDAIAQTRTKYGAYLSTIAYNILADREDSEECVGDTYLKVWNAIPQDKPSVFSAYIGKIVRNLSLNKYAQHKAQKRGGGAMALLLDELEDCLPAANSVEKQSDLSAVTGAINAFLHVQTAEKRAVFVRRYWYAQSINDLVRLTGYSESKIKSILFRLRGELKTHLEQEGIVL